MPYEECKINQCDNGQMKESSLCCTHYCNALGFFQSLGVENPTNWEAKFIHFLNNEITEAIGSYEDNLE